MKPTPFRPLIELRESFNGLSATDRADRHKTVNGLIAFELHVRMSGREKCVAGAGAG